MTTPALPAPREPAAGAEAGSEAGSQVLLLRLAAPLQSWGVRSAFNRRDTESEPTRSGIIGLLAAACGRAREEPLDDLLGLRVGVRVDVPGRLLRDYHVVSDYRGVPLLQAGVLTGGRQKATSPAKYTHVTNRYYLQDAVFVAGIEGPAEQVRALDRAVRSPGFPLSLGRRSCPPAQPLALGVRPGGLVSVLEHHPWQATRRSREQYAARLGRERRLDGPYRPATVRCSVTLDDPEGDDVLHDDPRSFDPYRRTFASRTVRRTWFDVPSGFEEPDGPDDRTPAPETAVDGTVGTVGTDGVTADPAAAHDPMILLDPTAFPDE
jgi:CRISPR system Cascade subunit CasD